MAALGRDGNVLGALSLVVADQMSDAVAAAADQSLTAAAALSALEHFADGCSVDRLRRILGLTSSGTVRLVDRLVAAGEVRRREGPDGRTTSIELTAAGRRAARRVTAARAGVLEDALGDLSPAERDDLERLAARVLDGVVRRKLAREAGDSTRWICRLCDTARVRARRGPLPGGRGGARARRAASPQAPAALRGAKLHHRGRGDGGGRSACGVCERRRFRPNRTRRRTGRRRLPSSMMQFASNPLAHAQRPVQEADRPPLVGGRVRAQTRGVAGVGQLPELDGAPAGRRGTGARRGSRRGSRRRRRAGPAAARSGASSAIRDCERLHAGDRARPTAS